MSDLAYSAEQIIRTACHDSGVNVAYMEWNDGELTLWLSVDEKVTLRPKMEDLYMEVLRALKKSSLRD